MKVSVITRLSTKFYHCFAGISSLWQKRGIIYIKEHENTYFMDNTCMCAKYPQQNIHINYMEVQCSLQNTLWKHEEICSVQLTRGGIHEKHVSTA